MRRPYRVPGDRATTESGCIAAHHTSSSVGAALTSVPFLLALTPSVQTNGASDRSVHLKITCSPKGCIDGIQLEVFQVGRVYDIGVSLACVLLAEGWAEPATNDHSAIGPSVIFLPHLSKSFPPLRAEAASDTSRRRRKPHA
jgi:hypothetical protein